VEPRTDENPNDRMALLINSPSRWRLIKMSRPRPPYVASGSMS
jgi:hypothetical protein